MLKDLSQSLSINATSSIGNTVISYMSANVAIPGGANINNSIQNMTEYLANQDAVDADFEEFKAKVLEILKQYKKAEV